MEHVELILFGLLLRVAALTFVAGSAADPRYRTVVHHVLEAQRHAIVALRDDGSISDEAMHVLDREIDLEDARLEI